MCKNNWSSDIKKVLCDIERPQWFDPEGQFRLPLQEAEGCIVHLMNNVWKNDITVKPKLRTYVKIKNNCLAENYLDLNITRHRRSLIAQIRLGILPLEIEVGRFRGIAVDQRLCKCCNNNVTEMNFILFVYVHNTNNSEIFYMVNLIFLMMYLMKINSKE